MMDADRQRAKLVRQVALLLAFANDGRGNPAEMAAARAKAEEIKSRIDWSIDDEVAMTAPVPEPEVGNADFTVNMFARSEFGGKFDNRFVGSVHLRGADSRRWKNWLDMGVMPNEDGWVAVVGEHYIPMDRMIRALLAEAEWLFEQYIRYLDAEGNVRAISMRPARPYDPADPYAILSTEWDAQDFGSALVVEGKAIAMAKLRAIQNEIARRGRMPLPHPTLVDQYLALRESAAALPPRTS